MWVAEDEVAAYLALRGRGTWTSADTFRNLARTSLEAGRLLTIDLSDCTSLDSTYLGTLHEIVTLKSAGHTCVRGPNEVVRGLFKEIGLEDVLDVIRDDPFEPPAEQTLVGEKAPTRASHLLLLRAHETLCELSEENRARFSGVVRSLRDELKDDEATS